MNQAQRTTSLKATTKGRSRNGMTNLGGRDGEDSDENVFVLSIISHSEDSVTDSPVGETKDEFVATCRYW